MKRIFKIIRLPNLVIVGLSEYLLFYCLLDPLYRQTSVDPSLNQLEFCFLVFATILVTLGGYLINDIIDIETDKINKPEKVWVGRLCSKKQAILAYFFVNALGLILSVYTALSLQKWELALLYPIAAAGLYVYSSFLKQRPLIGNFIVSIFCGLVFVLVLFAEKEAFSEAGKIEPGFALVVYQVFLGFAFFAFFITMIRELVKDLEDVAGDKHAGLMTHPIAFGVMHTENIVRLLFYSTTIFGLAFIVWNIRIVNWIPWGMIYGLVFILLPLLFFTILFNSKESPKQYGKMSVILKLLMAGGLLYLPLFRWFIFSTIHF